VLGYVPQPSVVAGVVGLQALYWLCVDRYRDRFPGSAPVSPARRFAFTLGLGFLLLALATPLDQVADEYLFSAHMLQHLLVTLATAPLLLVGTPGWLLRALLQATHLTRLARWTLHPLIAYGLFNVVFSAAHLPAFYELTLHNELLHAAEHLVFLVTAIIMFMPVLSPLPDVLPRYHGLAQVLYLFLQTVPATLVGALLAIASGPYYPTYALAPRITGLSPLEDQQLGGLLMWVGTGFYFLIASAVAFFAWANREEAANQRPAQA
jgi:cytochrome c oxidase assembly factor CtaG